MVTDFTAGDWPCTSRRTLSTASRLKELSPHREHTVDGTPPTNTYRPSTLKTSSTNSVRQSSAPHTTQANSIYILLVKSSHSLLFGSYSVTILASGESTIDTWMWSGRPDLEKPSISHVGPYLSSGYSSTTTASAPASLISSSLTFLSTALLRACRENANSPCSSCRRTCWRDFNTRLEPLYILSHIRVNGTHDPSPPYTISSVTARPTHVLARPRPVVYNSPR